MDETLAQIINHVIEAELKIALKDQELAEVKGELEKYKKEYDKPIEGEDE